ncbi:class I SAM-dependent methyltransferase [uncultured Hyphomonas sp.]|uniref:class I SAM-dependent methyltransferase n=1 Tax=uncultured Hyphomonas sp. TaxID=225298 RepID=UPI000C661949|nr:SAM-dependent methyltransferase [Hyphomonadaceae bacterium]MBA29721.1 SAM-dependent methyltransferase [Hyphomonadaceae bacterium]
MSPAHMHPIARNKARLYPELAAGGFTRRDGTIAFYARVNALLAQTSRVLDFGAGRGRGHEDECQFRKSLLQLNGKAAEIIGVDVDPVVTTNPNLDQAMIIEPSQPINLPDNHFDIIVADWVLEHLDDPVWFAAEMQRLLKPGGWLCARTPNKWGLTGVGARLLPNRFHSSMLHKLSDTRQEQDVFPTRYRLNTLSAVRRYFPERLWEQCSYIENAEPPYVLRSVAASRMVQLFWRLSPTGFYTNLFVFLRKRPG